MYAQRLQSAALSLPNGVTENVLLHRLKEGIPLRMKDQAHLVTGSFDEEYTRMRRVSTVQML